MASIRATRGANHPTKGRLAVGTTALLVGLLTMGVAAAGPIAALTPTSLNFGGVKVNVLSATKTITVKNTGNATLTIGAVSLTGALKGHFAKKSDTCSGKAKAIGTTCAIGIAFKPLSMGTKTAAVSIPTNAGTKSAPLSGIGLAAAIQLQPASLSFPNVVGCVQEGELANCDPAADPPLTGESTALILTVRSVGTAPLVISTLPFVGAAAGDYFKTADSCAGRSIAPNQTCAVSIKFRPTTVGLRPASLQVNSNALGQTQKTVALSGTGVDNTGPETCTLPESPQAAASMFWHSPTNQAFTNGTILDNFAGFDPAGVVVRIKAKTDTSAPGTGGTIVPVTLAGCDAAQRYCTNWGFTLPGTITQNVYDVILTCFDRSGNEGLGASYILIVAA